jgi:hypothetical protein
LREQSEHGANSCSREAKSGKAGSHGDHEAFGNQLLGQPTAARSQRRADCEFASTIDGARQKEICDIDACGQKQQAYATREKKKQLPTGADELCAHWNDNRVHLFKVGRSRVMRAESTNNSACACSQVTPGFMRPITFKAHVEKSSSSF